jgi:hypothetical protein
MLVETACSQSGSSIQIASKLVKQCHTQFGVSSKSVQRCLAAETRRTNHAFTFWVVLTIPSPVEVFGLSPFYLEYELCDDDEQDGGDEHQEWSCLAQTSCHGTFFSQSDLPKFRQAVPQNFVCHVNLQAGLANFETP